MPAKLKKCGDDLTQIDITFYKDALKVSSKLNIKKDIFAIDTEGKYCNRIIIISVRAEIINNSYKKMETKVLENRKKMRSLSFMDI